MRVLIPHALRAYTDQADLVCAEGETLGELLHDLNESYPGIRFRMVDEQDCVRRHIVIFVGGVKTTDLDLSLKGCDEVVIAQALAGG